MFCKWNRHSCLFLLGVVLAGCSKPEPAANRVAVVPFENLSTDASLEWMGRAFSEVLKYQLSGLPDLDPVSVPSLRDAPSVDATHILQGYFSVTGGRLRVQAVLEDARNGRTVRTASAVGSPDSGVLGPADAVARQMDRRARPFGTRNAAAFKAFIGALEARDAAAAAKDFEAAVSADADFGAAYVAWAQLLVREATARRRSKSSRPAGAGQHRSRWWSATCSRCWTQRSREIAAASVARWSR